jgi:hypothetical protein
MAHGEWMTGDSLSFSLTRWRAKGKLVELYDEFTVEEINAVADGFESCRKRLIKFTDRKRFLEHTIFDEQVGVRRLWRRERAREREKARIEA